MSLLSRGDLRELTPLNWIADEADIWKCCVCGKVHTTDLDVVDHPTKCEVMCKTCVSEWERDNS